MSLLPYAFREMMRSLRTLEHQMRHAEEIFHPISSPFLQASRPRIEFPENTSESVLQDKEKFQVKLDVSDFKPENIAVKMLDNNEIQIEAKCEEKNDSGYIAKQLVRRFVFPKGHDLQNVVSKLSADGVLTITAPRNIKAEEEKIIPITHESTTENKSEAKKEIEK